MCSCFLFSTEGYFTAVFLKTNRIKVGYVFVANVDSFLKFKLPANNKIDRFIKVFIFKNDKNRRLRNLT